MIPERGTPVHPQRDLPTHPQRDLPTHPQRDLPTHPPWGTQPEAVLAGVVQTLSTITGGRPAALVHTPHGGPPIVVATTGGIDTDDLDALPVAVPVVVDGRPWGLLVAADDPLAGGTTADATTRLWAFAAVVGLAMTALPAWSGRGDVVAEQAAVRRVAEMAARGVPQDELLAAVATEASTLVRETVSLLRVGEQPFYAVVAVHGLPTVTRKRVEIPAGEDDIISEIIATRRSARLDHDGGGSAHADGGNGTRAAAGVPIVVDGRLWGILLATTSLGPLANGIEQRLAQFADLVAASVVGAQNRAEIQTLADQQAALLRVAELVARGRPLPEIFRAVTAEASALLGGRPAALLRYDESDAVFLESCNGPAVADLRLPLDGDTATAEVHRTGRPKRIDTYDGTVLDGLARTLGVVASVTVPVIAEGRVWGTLSTSTTDGPVPDGVELLLGSLAGLAAAAIMNAENRAKLTASRARVVATADETRRRIQRDVHDSAQQRLVHTLVTLGLAIDALAAGRPADVLLREAVRHAERAIGDLRDVVRGIMPAALGSGGLAAGLQTLVEDVPVPVDLEVTVPRLPTALETTGFFVVAEALTNVVKHAQARTVVVRAALRGGHLVIDVRDDGVGGADPARGTGLTGLLDRVEAAEGTLIVSSEPGVGTTVHVDIPTGPAPAAGAPPL